MAQVGLTSPSSNNSVIVGCAPHRATVRISFDANFTEVRPPGVKVEQTIRERTTDTKDQLQRFRGLDCSDDPRQHSDHAGFLARCHQAGRRRSFEDTSVTGRLLRGMMVVTRPSKRRIPPWTSGLSAKKQASLMRNLPGKLSTPSMITSNSANIFKAFDACQAFFIEDDVDVGIQRLDLFLA